jgi:Antitoxin VbhA
LASATQNVTKLTADEVELRRLAVEGAIGSLHIEGMEPDARELEIVNQFARGEIELATMHEQMEAYIEADL